MYATTHGEHQQQQRGNREAEKRAARAVEETEMRANPPEAVTLRFKRYQGPQLAALQTQLCNSQADRLTSVLLLPNPGRQMLPVTRLMCKDCEPPLPNKWNTGKGLPTVSFGMVFPIAPSSLVATEDVFLDRIQCAIGNLGIEPDNILLTITDAHEPTFLMSKPNAIATMVQFLIIAPPDDPTPALPEMQQSIQPPPFQPPFQLPFQFSQPQPVPGAYPHYMPTNPSTPPTNRSTPVQEQAVTRDEVR
jgi:hypothetical protein